MSNLLTASYSLKIKAIYTDIKDGISRQLKQFEWVNNRKRMVKYAGPSVKKAYKEGVDYAVQYTIMIFRSLILDNKKSISENEELISNSNDPEKIKTYEDQIKVYKEEIKAYNSIITDLNKVKPKMSTASVNKIYQLYLEMIKSAEKIYKQKIDNLRNIDKINGTRIKLKTGSQEDQAWNEYVNGAKSATNNLIINSGAEGQGQVWQKL